MNKLKEKANPEIEFANDPMLKELHKIQLRISENINSMNGKEIVKYFGEKLRK